MFVLYLFSFVYFFVKQKLKICLYSPFFKLFQNKIYGGGGEDEDCGVGGNGSSGGGGGRIRLRGSARALT